MSRPLPNIILEHVDRQTYKADQILEADAIWAVFYKGRPFNLKTVDKVAGGSCPKYKKVSFSNSGHAHNLAKKLNDTFQTTDFYVVKLTDGIVEHQS